jgi:hypothetical protein
VNLLGVPEEVEGNRHGGALEDKRFERRLQDEVDQRGSSDDGCDRQDRSLVRLHALLTGRLAGTETLIEQAYECGRESIPWDARIARLRQRVVLFTLTRADARRGAGAADGGGPGAAVSVSPGGQRRAACKARARARFVAAPR